MRTLISNYLPSYASEVVLFRTDGELTRFKISSETGYDFYILKIEIQTKNRNYECVATKNDIPCVEPIKYNWDEEKRIQLAKENIEMAKRYIIQVFGED